jgi:hypothetical protein
MRKVLLVFSALLIISLGTSIVSAQTPNVQVFFDEYFGKTHLDQCPVDPPGTVIGNAYVVASNFNVWISAIEYAIQYPPQLIFAGDNTGGLDIGQSAANGLNGGIATSWPFPINGYSPVLVNTVSFIFNCQLCFTQDIPIVVVNHEQTGFIRIATWPDNILVNGVGMKSLICPTVPAEDTTWGSIKALYN